MTPTPASNLSDEDIDAILIRMPDLMNEAGLREFARAIEAKVLDRARATAEPVAWQKDATRYREIRAQIVDGTLALFPDADDKERVGRIAGDAYDKKVDEETSKRPNTAKVAPAPMLEDSIDSSAEAVRMAYKTGYDEGYSDASDGLVDHDACEEGWQQYSAALGATVAPSPAPDRLQAAQDSMDRKFRSAAYSDASYIKDLEYELNRRSDLEAAGASPEPTAEQKFDARWEIREPLRLALFELPRSGDRLVNLHDVLSALDAALAVGTEIPQKQPPATDRNVAVGSTRFSDGKIQTEASLADEIRKSMLAAADEAIAANAEHQVEAPIQLPDVSGTV